MKQNRSTQPMLIVALCLLPAVSAFAAPDANSCAKNPDTRQLDYWLGIWTLPDANGSGTTTSSVHLSLDQCMFVEHAAPNKLQETWEKSTDNGANWSTVYRADYVRATP